jgi:2-amino-4-hydroxy-6-hydroxymethyldihydropteridine diphosphokinase
MPLCLIGLGSNLGDREGLLDKALARLLRHPDIELLRRGRYVETLPAGGPSAQPAYLNSAAVLQTSLSPTALLAEMQRVERELGRQRIEHWGPRSVDLDLLLYDDVKMDEPGLIIPHPRMAWRRFVLEPAAEIAPEMIVPEMRWSIARLLDHLNQTPWYLALAGPIAVGKSYFAAEIAKRTGARLLAEEFDPSRLEAFYRNPSGLIWETELEFLEQRAQQLRADRPEWADKDRPVVSDFCFDQVPVFAEVWLQNSEEPFFLYLAEFARFRKTVVQPRLTVLLCAPMETLLARIRARGRTEEDSLNIERLQHIERGLEVWTELGPVLRLDALDQEAALVEMLAAVEAMR